MIVQANIQANTQGFYDVTFSSRFDFDAQWQGKEWGYMHNKE